MHSLQKSIFISSMLVMLVFTALPGPVLAGSWVTTVLGGQELIPDACRIGPQERNPETGQPSCGFREISITIVNITRLILGLMGSVALLMFTYGGVMFLVSAGNQERVSRAKSILMNATWGIVLILMGWSIINFILLALTGGNLFGVKWTRGPR